MKNWQAAALTAVIVVPIFFWLGGEAGYSTGFIYGATVENLNSSMLRTATLTLLQRNRTEQAIDLINTEIDGSVLGFAPYLEKKPQWFSILAAIATKSELALRNIARYRKVYPEKVNPISDRVAKILERYDEGIE